MSGLADEETTQPVAVAAGNRLLAASTLMAAGTLVSRLLGLVRNMLAGYALSTDKAQADMFALALSIPTMLYFVFAGGTLNTVLVPQIVRAIKNDEDQGEAYVNRIITAFGAATLLFTVIVTLAARPLTWLLTDKKWHTPENAALFDNMADLTRMTMPQVFFWGVFFMCGQVLNAKERFGPMMWAPVANNLVQVILFAVYASIYGTNVDHRIPFTSDQQILLAGGTTLAVIAQGALLVFYLRKAGFRYRPRWDLRGTGLGRTVTMAKWVLWTVVITQIANAVVQRFATSATANGEGAGLVVYQSAFLLWMMPHGLVTVSLVTALMPHMSRLADSGDTKSLRVETLRALRLTASIMVPVAVAMAILAKPIATLLWGYGAAAGGVDAIAWTLIAFCLGVPMFSATFVMVRVLYAFEDSRAVFWLSAAFDIGNIVLAVAFIFPFHNPDWVAPGLALAYALAHLPVLPFYYRAVNHHVGGVTMGDTLRHWARITLATIPAGVLAWAICWFTMRATSSRWALAGAFVASAVVGVVAFIAASRLLKISEVTDVVELLTSRLRRRTPAAMADAGAQQAAEPGREDPSALDTLVAAEPLDDDPEDPDDDNGRTRGVDPDATHVRAVATPVGQGPTATMAAPGTQDDGDPGDSGTGGSEQGDGADPSGDDAEPTDEAHPDGVALEPGEVLGGRYRLEEHLVTREGIATWRAFDTVLSRAVLAQVLPPHDERTSALMGAARRAATATDSRFLRVLDAVLSDDDRVGSWVVGEFVPGRSLEVLLADGPLSALEAGWIVREVADALTTMHAQGLHHLRLNPDTVMIAKSGNVKIVGFLTEAVLHPEPGDDHLSEADREAADVEALGKLLHAMLTGTWPGGEAYGLPAAPTNETGWATPRQVRGGVSPALDTICDQILSRPPRDGERPLRSVHAVLSALARVLGSVDGANDLERRMRRPVLPGQRAHDASTMDSALTRPSGHSPQTAQTAPSAAEQTIVVTEVHGFVTPSEPDVVDPLDPLSHVDPLSGAHKAKQARRPDRTLPLLLLIIGALVVSLVLGLSGMYARSKEGKPAATATTSTTSKGATQAASLVVLPVTDVTDFDPEGSRSETPGELGFAVDGNPATAWHTERYSSSQPANIAGVAKAGIGIILDLGAVAEVRQVKLTMDGEPTTMEIRVPADATATTPPMDAIASWTKVADLPAASTSVTATLASPARARYVLVWITRLPLVPQGYQAAVAEAVVLG